METELLGMPGREVLWNFTGFFKSLNETYRFFSIFRLRGLHLTCFVEERNWGFFGGSIDTIRD
jgi:hypothetical protein